jgi:LysM repeat protein
MQKSIIKNRGKSTLEEIAEDYGVSVDYLKRVVGL